MPGTPRHSVQPRRHVRFDRFADSRAQSATNVSYFLISTFDFSSSILVGRQSFGAPFFFDVIDHVLRGLEFVRFEGWFFLPAQNAVPPTPLILPRVVTRLRFLLGDLGRDPFVHPLFPILVFSNIADCRVAAPVVPIFANRGVASASRQ